jgi:hypothetical protein
MRFFILLLGVGLIIASCATTNNLYVYDATPCEPEQYKFNAGIGTGYKPKFDSVVRTQHQLQYFPVLSFNGQIGLTQSLDKTNLRFSIWTPMFTSLGGRLGIQQSIFNHYSKFNIAIGFDIGYSLTSDSTKNSGYSEFEIKQQVLTSEVYLPFTYNFNHNSNVTITPKLTYNYFSFPLVNSLRNNNEKFDYLKINSPGLTIGLTLNKFHIEMTVTNYLNKYFPSLGMSYIISKE